MQDTNQIYRMHVLVFVIALLTEAGHRFALFVYFEINDQSLNSKNDCERNSVCAGDRYAIKLRRHRTPSHGYN